jgi:hypothetical protein
MRSVLAIALCGALTLAASTAFAGQKGHGPKVLPPKGGSHGGGTHGGGSHAKVLPPKGGSHAKVLPPKGGSHTGSPKVKGGGHAVATTGSKRTTTPTTTTTTNTGTTPLTPVQLKLQKNTNLASKLSGRLPAGTDLMTAAEGFRNLGQFVAAVNVSHNLGIPFADLKTAMVVDGMSLGQAIKSERPSVDSTMEARRAESDASRMIGTTDTTTTPTKKTKSSKPAKTKGRG